MGEVLRRRNYARGWVTRSKNDLFKVISAKELDREEIQDAIDDLDNKLEKLDTLQADYEISVEDETAEIDEAADFRNAVKDIRRDAMKVLAALSQVPNSALGKEAAPTDDRAVLTPSNAIAIAEAQLPKLILPKFDIHYVSLRKLSYHLLRVTY